MSDYYHWQGDVLILRVHAQPRASKTELVGQYGDALKIRVNSPPVDGKANLALIKYLAKLFAVSKSHIELLSGETSREKRFAIKSPNNKPEEVLP